jgi:hypothetical protein
MDNPVANGDGRNRRHRGEERLKGLAMVGGRQWFGRPDLASARDCELRRFAPDAAKMRAPCDVGFKARHAHAR